MAQTRTITRQKKIAFAAVDAGAALLSLFFLSRRKSAQSGKPKSFLVIEPWGIGDIVLVTPLLAGIRSRFPDAKITLLAKSYAEDLLRESKLVDEVISFDFPWTSLTRKYAVSRYRASDFRRLIRELRSRSFDVALDARRDIRSNLISYYSGARRRIGYDFGGGARLLTDILPSGDQNDHKTLDWLKLLEPFGEWDSIASHPRLAVTERERDWARSLFRDKNIGKDRPIVVIHPGASSPLRRWNPGHLAEVIGLLRTVVEADLLLIEDPDGHAAGLGFESGIPSAKLGLRELMAVIAECDVVFCSDSAAMHIAHALGTPVTALFGPQRAEWYGPRGKLDRVVQVDPMPCRPCFDSCIYASAICMESISPIAVVEAIRDQLAQIQSAEQARSEVPAGRWDLTAN